MGHHLMLEKQSAYGRMIDRLNRFPQGAPASDTLYAILKMLFTEKEADLVAQMPIKPFTARDAADRWKISETEAHKILDNMAGRALLVDLEVNGEQQYCLPPPMAGFFEFAMMRVRTDIDQKALAELYHQYINIEEDFMRELFVTGDTGLGRVFVQEPAVKEPYAMEILDWEKASEVIETARYRGISMCYCRHKKQHLGTACDAPMDICMTFNTAARSLIKHGHAREVSKSECMELLHQAWEHNLVQFGENVREGVNFICNCCGCCCEALGAVKRFQMTQTIHSNFIMQMNEENCVKCGRCAQICPVNAITLVKDADGKRHMDFNAELCLGCGVCTRGCAKNAITLVPRPERTITPLNTTHRAIVMATERGCLQDLIFDNRMLFSHRLLAAVLGAVLRMPALQRSLAQKQLKSRFIENLSRRL
ncbi:4Fe-4S dicluster domain-containing protein [uncultured Mailhella sp.]|uniref:4Fe-4S dicluster domain-containing protein n=1 Tax=uncultured Mailhella sp. TaxID=1981031 RepID=UPI00262175E3|nr:4Fe-4S dicluster domain-containing protein [uncultured Mailhella sp.]